MSEQPSQLVDVYVENNVYQHLEVLKRNREKRHRYDELFVEGVASINALIQTGHTILSAAHSREKPLSRWAKGVLRDANPAHIYRLTGDLMAKLSDRSEPSELIVTVRPMTYTLDDIALTPDLLAVVFERPSNHGNLGSLMRSCDAFGADALITTGHGIDPYDPAVIRASLGAIFHTRIIPTGPAVQFEGWISHARAVLPDLRVIGTSAAASVSVLEAAMTPPLIVVLGNEAQGMGRRLEQLVDMTVAIPMQGHVDSLNVACAGSILLYQAKANSVRRAMSGK